MKCVKEFELSCYVLLTICTTISDFLRKDHRSELASSPDNTRKTLLFVSKPYLYKLNFCLLLVDSNEERLNNIFSKKSLKLKFCR